MGQASEEEKTGMIDLNISLFIQMANFLVLLLLMNYVLYRPIRGVLKKRQEKMDSLSSEADRFSERLVEIQMELAEVVRQAQAEGFERRAEMKNRAHEQEKKILARVSEEMEAEAERIMAEIKDQVNEARESLLGQVEGFSAALAEKILGRSLS